MCGNNHDVAKKRYYRIKGRHTTVTELLEEISDELMAMTIWRKCDAAVESFLLEQTRYW
jgi:hypothetical protein